MGISVLTGSASKSSASRWRRAGAYWQGWEINSLRMERSMLPIVGRRAEYDIYNTTSRKFGYEYNWFDDAIASEYEAYIRFENRESEEVLNETALLRESDGRTPTAEAAAAQARLDSLSGSISHKGSSLSWWLDNSTDGVIRYQMPNNRIHEVISFAVAGSESYGYESAIHRRDTPYTDLEKYNAVRYVQGGASGGPPIGMEPVYGDSPSYDSTITFSAIIEPFEIRSILFGKYVFLNYENHPGGIFALIENIQTTRSVRPDVIKIGSEKVSPYEDSNTVGATSPTSPPIDCYETAADALKLNPTSANAQHLSDTIVIDFPSSYPGDPGSNITITFKSAAHMGTVGNYDINIRTRTSGIGAKTLRNLVIGAINGNTDPMFVGSSVSYGSSLNAAEGVPGLKAYVGTGPKYVTLVSTSGVLSTAATPVLANGTGAANGNIVRHSTFINDSTLRAERLLEPIYVNDEVKYIHPFEDRDMYAYVSPDAGIISVLRLMDATLDEGDVPIDHIPHPTGWVGDATDVRSTLVYRGLLR